jgi:secreted trypsin-like serine protease
MDRNTRPPLLAALLTLVLVIGSGVAFFCPAASAATPPRAQTSVVGGAQAQPGVLSSLVFITAQTGAATAMACSGTVLAPTVVLTAAHCVVDDETRTIRPASGIVVTAGSLDRTSGGVEVGAARIAVHPDYDPGAIRSDAAVIRLATPLTIAPLTLAAGADAGLAAPGASATFAGWGTTSGGSSEAAVTLQTATTTVLPDDACQRLLGSTFAAAVTLCAIDTGRFSSSTCRGDSGGPLLTRRSDGAWLQIGITSWGSLGCNTRVPQAFTRVSAVAPWISSQLAEAAAAAGSSGSSSPGGIGDAGLATSGAPTSATRRAGGATARYRGRTSQRRGLALRVAGARVVGAEFGWRAQCTRGARSGSFRLANGIRPKIVARAGRSAFAVASRDGRRRHERLTGLASGAGLRGTLRVSWRDRSAGRCDSGVVRWSAAR